jgi:hypothetical protein
MNASNRRELIEGVSFAKFAALARRKEWSAEYLAESLRGKFEVKGETFEHYFDRVLRGNPSSEVVIPFRSMIAKFVAAVEELARDGKLKLCPCGCGSYAGPGGRLAWPMCSRPPLSDAKQAALERAHAARREKAVSMGLVSGTMSIENDLENVHLARTSDPDLR